MMSAVLYFYCPQKNETAGKPNAKRSIAIQLNNVRPEDVPEELKLPEVPNDGVFEKEGSAYLQLNQVTDAFAAKITSGKTYKVTIEEIP